MADPHRISSEARPAALALRWTTLLTAILAFPLVWLGGLVTSHAAGMSVPDWPNSFGYNMFALPFSMWLGSFAGGTFYEHSHRLLGTLVGLSAFAATLIAWAPSRHYRWRRIWGSTTLVCAIGFVTSLVIARVFRANGRINEDVYKSLTHVFSLFAGLAVAAFIGWRCRGYRDTSRARRWAVTLVLGFIILQGLMGGLRVDRVSLLLAKAHGIFGQLTFATAAVVATACSRWWTGVAARPSEEGRWLRRLAGLAIVLIAMQLTLGALMRHDPRRSTGSFDGAAGLAIPDWPLHYGRVIPPTSSAELATINWKRTTELDLQPVKLSQIWLHFAHRLGAYTTSLVIFALAIHVWRRHRDKRAIVRPATLLACLVLVQVTLGVLTVLWRKPADIATAHQATGALLLMTACVLLARAIRVYPLPARRSSALPADRPTGVANVLAAPASLRTDSL